MMKENRKQSVMELMGFLSSVSWPAETAMKVVDYDSEEKQKQYNYNAVYSLTNASAYIEYYDRSPFRCPKYIPVVINGKMRRETLTFVTKSQEIYKALDRWKLHYARTVDNATGQITIKFDLSEYSALPREAKERVSDAVLMQNAIEDRAKRLIDELKAPIYRRLLAWLYDYRGTTFNTSTDKLRYMSTAVFGCPTSMSPMLFMIDGKILQNEQDYMAEITDEMLYSGENEMLDSVLHSCLEKLGFDGLQRSTLDSLTDEQFDSTLWQCQYLAGLHESFASQRNYDYASTIYHALMSVTAGKVLEQSSVVDICGHKSLLGVRLIGQRPIVSDVDTDDDIDISTRMRCFNLYNELTNKRNNRCKENE